MTGEPEEGSYVDGDGLLSDDSSFYGDGDLRQHLDAKSSAFDPAFYWSSHDLQPSVIAFKAATKDGSHSMPKPVYNMYENYPSGRHLSESVPQFLERLPPHTTQLAEFGPSIYIANPAYRDRPTEEDLRGFRQRGAEILEQFNGVKEGIEASMPGKTKGVIGRKLTPLRKQLENDIYALARQKGITSGKWMLFPLPDDVNRIWSLVAQAVADGELGHAAKVATDDGTGNRGARLICVYNENFADRGEVGRVLKRLDGLGLIKAKAPIGDDRAIYYKADAYTHLDITSGNEWGLKPSLYSSKEVFGESWT